MVPWLGLWQAIFFRTACATGEGALQMGFACVAARTFYGLCGLVSARFMLKCLRQITMDPFSLGKGDPWELHSLSRCRADEVSHASPGTSTVAEVMFQLAYPPPRCLWADFEEVQAACWGLESP